MVNDASVVILAAGQGTRMKSRMAKVLHRAGGKALVEHVIDAARGIASAERIFVAVGHQAKSVAAVAGQSGVGSFGNPSEPNRARPLRSEPSIPPKRGAPAAWVSARPRPSSSAPASFRRPGSIHSSAR